MFTDSHAHLLAEYYEDIDEIIANAKKNGINRIINNGCSGKENKEILKSINNYPNIFGAIGIHPECVDNYSLEDIEFIKKHLQDKKVIALGEIGLDYYHTKEYKEEQKELFRRQLKMAEENNMPVIVHSREATLDTLNILKEFKVKGLIHSFSGSYETALEYIKMGYLIGINGVITFKNANIKDVIKKLPLDSIVLETDSPYLTPVPYRGKRNEPKYISIIASFVSALFEIESSDLADITNQNLARIFDKLS